MVEPDERFWDDLLDYIQERTVIPVIGSELVAVHEKGNDVLLDRWLAVELAAELRLPTARLPKRYDLNDVVSLHLRRRGQREELYPQIHRLLRKAPAAAAPLRALAGISDFGLFVTLTFDSLLADLVAARGGDGPSVERIAYAPNTPGDLGGPKATLPGPVVFHLLGRASPSPFFAICDEDLLEFLHAMQDEDRRPTNLFDDLQRNHLLILGCGYGDWLARFFLRTARSLGLSQNRRFREILVGEQLAHDANLARFLESFSSNARVVPWSAARFVTKLAELWQARHASAAVAAPMQQAGGSPSDHGRGAIFISYATEDLAVARRLAESLRTAGLDVWFDKRDLQCGESWKRKILRGIEDCSLFLPVISRQTVLSENVERFYWREWNAAHERAAGMAPDAVFIVPVTVDDTPPDHPRLLPSFRTRHRISCPQGDTTPLPLLAEAKWLREQVLEFHRRRAA